MSMRFRSAILIVLALCGAAGAADAAVFVVNNTNDSGPGSLRQAILDSNRAPGPNVIEIDLPGGGAPNVIKPTGQFLPPIKGPVIVRIKGTEPVAPPPAPAVGRGGRGGRGANPPAAGQPPGGRAGETPPPAPAPVAPPPAPPKPIVILDGSNLVKPRTPDACPGATVTYNAQTNQWDSSRLQGTGPNVRGYYGAGLAVHDSENVEIYGLEIRNFCIGIAVVRSHDVNLHDLKISDSHGAAGVIFTGDDGNATSTAASYNNRLLNSVLLDNGDGFEFTRGTHDSLLQGTTIALTQPLPVNGNAVEFASAGDRNALIGNTFTKYVDTAVTVGGADQTIRDNRFIANEGAGMRASGANLLIIGNIFLNNGGDAMWVSGAGSRVMDNLVSGNGGKGIVVGSTGVMLNRNSIFDDAHLGIDAGAGGRGGGGGRRGAAPPGSPGGRGEAPAAAPALPAPPVAPLVLPDPPVVEATSKWSGEGITVDGSLTGRPGERYAVEVFLSRAPDRHEGDEHGWGEGQVYIGTASATPNASGNATFSLTVRIPDLLGEGQASGFVTATAKDAAGSTSRFSRSLPLSRR